MSLTVKASTQALMTLAGIEPSKLIVSAADEHYCVYRAVIALSNGLYRELGKQKYESEPWPADGQTIQVLREAMCDNKGNYAGQAIAHLLLRTGCRRADTFDALHPWDAIAFNWQRAGYSTDDIRDIVHGSGIVADISSDGLSKIATWLAHPAPIRGASCAVPTALFGEKRIVFSSLRDSGFEPAHHGLFEKLISSLDPPVQITNVRQSVDRIERFETKEVLLCAVDGTPMSSAPVAVMSDDGAHWVVQFEFQGKTHAFFARCNGTWLDRAAVLKNFDAFMASLRRSERAYQFEIDRGESGEWGLFMAADGERFQDIVKRLFIPLLSYE